MLNWDYFVKASSLKNGYGVSASDPVDKFIGLLLHGRYFFQLVTEFDENVAVSVHLKRCQAYECSCELLCNLEPRVLVEKFLFRGASGQETGQDVSTQRLEHVHEQLHVVVHIKSVSNCGFN